MSTILILLMFLFGMLYFQSPPHAFLFLLAEFFLGGSGQYFFAFGISIRSLFLISFLTLTLLHQVGVHFYREQKHIPNWLLVTLGSILFYTVLAIGIGIKNGHSITAVNEATPFFYLLIVFPAYAMYRRYSFLRTNTARLAVVAIFGTELFAFLNAILFASGITTIGDRYYDWFVSMNSGMITVASGSLHYISESSNIIVVPILLIITSLLMRREKHHWLWWTLHAILLFKLTLAPNVWYAIALAVGLILLMFEHRILRWVTIVSYTTILFFTLVISTSLLFSGFTTTGVPVLFQTAQTQLFDTIQLGQMQWSPIMTTATKHPILGTGFGSTITYFDTTTGQYMTTSEYAWNYLELLIEIGALGLLLYMLLVLGVLLTTIKKITQLHDYHDFYVGVFASIISLLILQIGIPVLTTTYGIFTLMFGVLIVTKETSSFDQFVIFLYRLFHRKKI